MANSDRVRAWEDRDAIKQGIHAIQNEIEPIEAWAMADELCGQYNAQTLDELQEWVDNKPL